MDELVENHVFRAQVNILAGDLYKREEYNERLANALDFWKAFLAEIPEEWRFVDVEKTIPVNFDLQQAHHWLEECHSDDFWTWL